MAEIEYDDWMSETDALMWHMERDPVLRSTITTVWVLDRPPDAARFESALELAVREVPRLRQRVVADATAIAPPKWEVDPMFDMDYHFRTGRVGGEGSMRDLLDQAAPIAMQSFDKDRPLWELHLLDGMADGRTGVVMKLHHAVSDGVGLVKMTGSLMERDRDSHPAPGGRPPPSPRFGNRRRRPPATRCVTKSRPACGEASMPRRRSGVVRWISPGIPSAHRRASPTRLLRSPGRCGR